MSSNNLVLFDEEGTITRFASAGDILKQWFGPREELYQRRKDFMLAKLKKEHAILSNKARFIKAVIAEEIQIKRVKKMVIARSLKA